MAREKELFRINLEQINRAFPSKDCLSPSDVAGYMGVSRTTVYRRLKDAAWSGNTRGRSITRAALANALS